MLAGIYSDEEGQLYKVYQVRVLPVLCYQRIRTRQTRRERKGNLKIYICVYNRQEKYLLLRHGSMPACVTVSISNDFICGPFAHSVMVFSG